MLLLRRFHPKPLCSILPITEDMLAFLRPLDENLQTNKANTLLTMSRKVAPKGIPRVCLAKQVSARPGLLIDSSIQPPPWN